MFRDLTVHEIAEVMRACREAHFEPGDIVMRQGEAATNAFIIGNGAVQAIVRLPGGGETELAVRHSGEIVGEMAAAAGGQRNATVRALSRTSGYFIDYQAFSHMVIGANDAAFKVQKRLLQQLAARFCSLIAAVAAAGLWPDGPSEGPLSPARPPQRSPVLPGDRLLALLPALREFSREDLAELLRQGSVLAFEQGEMLWRDHPEQGVIWVVLYGAVQLLIRQGSTARQVLLLGPGRVAGAAAVVLAREEDMLMPVMREGGAVLAIGTSALDAFLSAPGIAAAKFQTFLIRNLAADISKVSNLFTLLESQRRIRERMGRAR